MSSRHAFRAAAALLASLALAPPSMPGAEERTYASLLEQARADLARGEYASSLATLDLAVRTNPDGAEGLALLGRAYVGMEKYAEALAPLQLAAEIAERAGGPAEARVAILSDLAIALARQERSDEAIAVLRKILSLAPGRARIHHDIGRIDLAIGALQKAESEFQEEIDLQSARPGPPDPALAMSLEGLGIAAYRLGDDARALAAFERRDKLREAPMTVEGRYHSGLALLRSGRPEEAAAAFRDVLKRSRDDRGALQSLARCDAALGLADERRASLARFEELYREEEERKATRLHVRDLRAEARQRSDAGKFGDAVAKLKEAVSIAPEDDEIRLELGRALSRAGQQAGAADIFRRVLERQPLDAEAHFQLGRLLADGGDVTAALPSLERAARLQPMSLAYHTALAQLYLRLHRDQDGVRELRLARSLDPKNPESAFNLGLGLAQSGALREGATEIETAARMGYAQPVLHQVLSQIYGALGDAARAAQEKAAFEKLQGGGRSKP
ncbi:MAG: tetratricopeptide repeat protein [Acidobacteria bacterium]|nr:tetratricopeptide repeat protein [Acidobacteriota bacterium]